MKSNRNTRSWASRGTSCIRAGRPSSCRPFPKAMTQTWHTDYPSSKYYPCRRPFRQVGRDGTCPARGTSPCSTSESFVPWRIISSLLTTNCVTSDAHGINKRGLFVSARLGWVRSELYMVRWLSTVAPLVGCPLSARYASGASDHARTGEKEGSGNRSPAK